MHNTIFIYINYKYRSQLQCIHNTYKRKKNNTRTFIYMLCGLVYLLSNILRSYSTDFFWIRATTKLTTISSTIFRYCNIAIFLSATVVAMADRPLSYITYDSHTLTKFSAIRWIKIRKDTIYYGSNIFFWAWIPPSSGLLRILNVKTIYKYNYNNNTDSYIYL